MPSSCDRGGIKADPVARDPTRPQQPAPPQRGGSCQRPNPSPHPSSEIKKENAGASRSDPRARRSAPPRPSRARGVAIKVNAAQNACRASQLGVPSRREAPSAVQLRSGWNQSRPGSSRPNAAAAAGAAAAGRQLPTPEPQPSPQQRNQKRKRRRQPQRSQSAAVCAAPALARARAVAPTMSVQRASLVPSSCDRGGIKADPVARDPTRPQQPAPPQRGGSCQRPNPSPHPSSEIKKERRRQPQRSQSAAVCAAPALARARVRH